MIWGIIEGRNEKQKSIRRNKELKVNQSSHGKGEESGIMENMVENTKQSKLKISEIEIARFL